MKYSHPRTNTEIAFLWWPPSSLYIGLIIGLKRLFPTAFQFEPTHNLRYYNTTSFLLAPHFTNKTYYLTLLGKAGCHWLIKETLQRRNIIRVWPHKREDRSEMYVQICLLLFVAVSWVKYQHNVTIILIICSLIWWVRRMTAGLCIQCGRGIDLTSDLVGYIKNKNTKISC